jgi:hypothetical protein
LKLKLIVRKHLVLFRGTDLYVFEIEAGISEASSLVPRNIEHSYLHLFDIMTDHVPP